MIVKVCEVDFDNQIAYVCDAADQHSSGNNIGRIYVGWFRNTVKGKTTLIPPIQGKSYSFTPKIEWLKANKTILLHGQINSPTPLEDSRNYHP